VSAALVAVPAVPLAAAALIAAARPSWRLAAVAACAASALAPILLLVSRGDAVEVGWLDVARWHVAVGLRADGLAWTTALLVAGVSLVVNVYSAGYMAHGRDRRRFFAWMSFFQGAMLALVLASSLVLLFAAWEAVGLASWALIAHEDRDPAARRAGAQAFLVTRLGDMGLLLAIAVVLEVTGSSDVAALGAQREVRVGSADRIDFLLPGGLGVEVKINGSLSGLTRQVHRYAQREEISALIVVTTRHRLAQLPDTMHGKPVRVVKVGGW